jgi:predicted CoA-binding protein
MDTERARAWDMLDVAEGRGPVPLADGAGAAALLREAKRIAIVGASASPGRPSHGVMRYLLSQGYECIPVNPNASEVLGVTSYASLEDAAEAGGPFDIVDVFRRPDAVVDIARSAVATGARALWLQLGVVNWEAARIADAGGLSVVMDRCTAIEHRRLRAS